MIEKQLSPVQKMCGDAFSGRCQKRYRHKRDYELHKDGEKLPFFFMTNTTSIEEEKEQILEQVKMAEADKVTLRWGAVVGFPATEVVVWTEQEGFVDEGVFI